MDDKRLILVKEKIFTDEIAQLHDKLDKSIKTINIETLKQGIEEKELMNAITNIKQVRDVLRELSEKKFQDATVKTVIIKY